jgi:hypothetical protein
MNISTLNNHEGALWLRAVEAFLEEDQSLKQNEPRMVEFQRLLVVNKFSLLPIVVNKTTFPNYMMLMLSI